MSRYFFVWLTFIGAVVVMREHLHLGVDMLVGKFGRRGRLACMMTSDALILFCCAVFFWGTWKQAAINASNVAPVSGLSMLWVFGVGYFTSVAIGLMVLLRLAARVHRQRERARAGGLRRDLRARRSRAHQARSRVKSHGAAAR